MQIWTGPQFSPYSCSSPPAVSFGMLGATLGAWPGGLSGTALESSFMGPGCNPGLLAQMLGQSIGTGGTNCPQAAWYAMMQQAPMQPFSNGNASRAMMLQMLPGAGNANLATMMQLGPGAGNANLATMMQLGQGAGNANLATMMQLGQGAGNANLATMMQLGQGAGNANLATVRPPRCPGDGALAREDLLSLDDLKAVMDPPQPMTLGLASQTVSNQFDLLDGNRDGLVGKDDLLAVLASPGAPDDLRRASHFLLDNPALRNALDTGSGQGQVDGLISRQDAEEATRLFSALDPNAPLPTDLRSASHVLEQYVNVADTASGRGGRDGIVGKLDLQALLDSPEAPAQLRESARLLLDNPSFFNRVDGAGALFGMLDNRFTLGDLQITAQ